MGKTFNYSATGNVSRLAVKSAQSQANNELVEAYLKAGNKMKYGVKPRKNKFRSKMSTWNKATY